MPFAGDRGSEPGWFRLPDLKDLPPQTVWSLEIEGVPLAVCRADGGLYVYRDACAACGSTLAGSRFDGTVLTCSGCQRQYDIRLAGRGVDDDTHLDPVPLVGNEPRAEVALPAGVRA